MIWPDWLTYSGRLPTSVVTRQLQVERRTGKVRRPKTDVLPLWPRNQTVCPVSILLGAVSCVIDRSRKNAEKDEFRGFRIIQGHRIWHRSNDFLLVTLVISRTLLKLRRLMVKKSPLGHTPVSFNALARDDPLRICWRTLYRQNLDPLRCLSVMMAPSYVHSFWLDTGVWRTDGQTDGYMLANTAPSIAVRCERAITEPSNEKFKYQVVDITMQWGYVASGWICMLLKCISS